MEFSTQLPCGFVVSSDVIRVGLADGMMWRVLRRELANEANGWEAASAVSNQIREFLDAEFLRAPLVMESALITLARAGGAKDMDRFFSFVISEQVLSDETLKVLIQYPELHHALAHRRQGPRWLMRALCDMMAAGEIEPVPEAALTLGLDLYADPDISCEEWIDFLNTFRSMQWLFDTVRINGEPSSDYKRLAFETIQVEARKLWSTASWRDLPDNKTEE